MSTVLLKALTIGGEEGWVDLGFGLVGKPRSADDLIALTVGARHAETDVGFNVVLPKSWEYEEQENMPGIGSYVGIALAAVRPQSDDFLKALATVYGIEVPPRMADFTELNAVSLEGNPENVLTEKIALKIFFGAHPEFGIPYAEAYLNLDVPNGIVQLHEKDPEYRKAIVEGLAKGTDQVGQQ
jgi:hypothetical protein